MLLIRTVLLQQLLDAGQNSLGLLLDALAGLTGSYTAQEQHIAILYHAAHPAGAVKTLNFHRGSFSFRFCVFCISSLPQLPVRFNRMVFLNNKKQEQS